MKIWLTLFLITLFGLPQAGNANDYGRMGMEAFHSGSYAIAEDFLKTALEEERKAVKWLWPNDVWYLKNKKVRETTKPWREALAYLYWETGKDHVLLDHAEDYLNEHAQDFWWCRVTERRAHHTVATDCWAVTGYEDRLKRTIRTDVLLDTFGPKDTVFGNRPPPPVSH